MKFNTIIIFLFSIYLTGCCANKKWGTNKKTLKYLIDISLNQEWGKSELKLKKWNSDIYIFLGNGIEQKIKEEFYKIIYDINSLSSSYKIHRTLSEGKANAFLYFKDHKSANDIIENIKVQNYRGYTRIIANSNYEIYKGFIFIDPSIQELECVIHVLREELTHLIGLPNDSNKYPNSIFYNEYSCITKYSELDSSIIRYFLNPSLKAGMGKEEIIQRLTSL